MNKNIPWLEHVNPSRLPEDYQLAIQAIGLENVIKLAFALPKVHLYLMSPDKLFLHAREEYVRAMYAAAGPGAPFSPRRAALETGLSERHVYEVIGNKQADDRQLSLL